MVHVIATIELVPGQREAFLTEFHRLMPLVHAEEGCQEYGPTVDVPTDIAVQVPIRENVVTVVEKWASLPALQAHLAAAHMQEYRARVKSLVVGAKIQVLQPA